MGKVHYLLGLILVVSFLNIEAHAGRRQVWPVAEDVPYQHSRWACGAYAGCRMMRTQGLDVTVDEIFQKYPRHTVFGWVMGPTPKELASHLTEVCGRRIRYEAVQLPRDTGEEQALEELRQSLAMGPVLVLVKSGVRILPVVGKAIQLHQLFIYGFDEDRNEFYVYDTDQTRTVLTGRELLARWFWDTEDKRKSEYNPNFAETLRYYGIYPKMFIRTESKFIFDNNDDDELMFVLELK